MRALNLLTLCFAAALTLAAVGAHANHVADGADIGGGRPAAGFALDGGQDSGGAPLAGGEIGNGFVRAVAENVGNGARLPRHGFDGTERA